MLATRNQAWGCSLAVTAENSGTANRQRKSADRKTESAAKPGNAEPVKNATYEEVSTYKPCGEGNERHHEHTFDGGTGSRISKTDANPGLTRPQEKSGDGREVVWPHIFYPSIYLPARLRSLATPPESQERLRASALSARRGASAQLPSLRCAALSAAGPREAPCHLHTRASPARQGSCPAGTRQ